MSMIYDFSQRPPNVIKQEHLQENLSRYSSPIPEPNPNYNLTLKQYNALEKRNNLARLPENVSTRKVILGLMKDRPDLWKRRHQRIETDKWKELGLDVYQRTGVFVNVESLVHTFRKARESLSRKMKKCRTEGRSVLEMELQLSQWELFSSFQFYYEFKLNNRHFDDEDDDDIEFLGLHNPSETIEQRDSSQNADNTAAYSERGNSFDYLAGMNYDATEPISKKPKLELTTDTDVEHIGYQIKRAFSQYPEKETLIRKAMFAAILKFDDSNFQDLGELFTSLAAKYTTGDRKYNL